VGHLGGRRLRGRGRGGLVLALTPRPPGRAGGQPGRRARRSGGLAGDPGPGHARRHGRDPISGAVAAPRHALPAPGSACPRRRAGLQPLPACYDDLRNASRARPARPARRPSPLARRSDVPADRGRVPRRGPACPDAPRGVRDGVPDHGVPNCPGHHRPPRAGPDLPRAGPAHAPRPFSRRVRSPAPGRRPSGLAGRGRHRRRVRDEVHGLARPRRAHRDGRRPRRRPGRRPVRRDRLRNHSRAGRRARARLPGLVRRADPEHDLVPARPDPRTLPGSEPPARPPAGHDRLGRPPRGDHPDDHRGTGHRDIARRPRASRYDGGCPAPRPRPDAAVRAVSGHPVRLLRLPPGPARLDSAEPDPAKPR
jgi:hypothetical protein